MSGIIQGPSFYYDLKKAGSSDIKETRTSVVFPLTNRLSAHFLLTESAVKNLMIFCVAICFCMHICACDTGVHDESELSVIS